MRSFKSSENIHKKEGGSYYVVSANKASSVTLLSPGNESQRKHTAILRISNRQSIQRLIYSTVRGKLRGYAHFAKIINPFAIYFASCLRGVCAGHASFSHESLASYVRFYKCHSQISRVTRSVSDFYRASCETNSHDIS